MALKRKILSILKRSVAWIRKHKLGTAALVLVLISVLNSGLATIYYFYYWKSVPLLEMLKAW